MFIGSEILAPDLVWQDLGDLLDPNYFQTLKAERERERLVLAYESLVISKNIMNGCWKASRAHRLLHDKVGYALYAFYRIPKCLNWRNILSWIPFGSDLDPNSDNVFFFFFKGERIQISLKAGHHRPASETPFNGVSLACRWWPNVECWLGCSENFRGFDLVLIRGPDPLVPPLDPRMGPDNVYTYWDILKILFIVRIGFCTALCILSIACTNFLIDETFFLEFHSPNRFCKCK